MNALRFAKCFSIAWLLALSSTLGLNKLNGCQESPPKTQEGVEVLTRGPVHEAFAGTVSFDPEPGLVAPKAPPAAIEELPPEQRPEGANVDWIPGYWAWDDERDDFLWVSGVWRALPPNRQWEPGYWSPSGQGAQWTSGYWADANVTEVEYLPEPPQTVEAGPNIDAQSADQIWLPGCWVWQQNRYAWRPGYWEMGRQDWIWIPAHYVWTPRGYVYIDSYYDYSVAQRGVLFAPVYFSSDIYSRSGFSYSPYTVINPSIFYTHLFLRPGYCHYYYGDYYASNYSGSGYSPWFSFNSSRYGYDPFYAQQRWLHRDDRNWESQIQANFQERRDNESARPPRTWLDQQSRIASAETTGDASLLVAATLDDIVKSKEIPLRLKTLDKKERQQFARHQKAVHEVREQRQKLEVQTADSSDTEPKSSRKARVTKVKLPASPIVALPADQLGKTHTPPTRREAPQPDLKVVPTARNPARDKNDRQTPPKRTTGAPQNAPVKSEPKRESGGNPQDSVPGNSGGKPPSESKEKTKGAANGNPQNGSNDKPQGKTSGKPETEPKQKPKK